MSPAGLLGLQRAAGNVAVAGLVSGTADQRGTLQRQEDENAPPQPTRGPASPWATFSAAFANGFASAIPNFFTNPQIGLDRTRRMLGGDPRVADENRDLGRLLRIGRATVIPVGTRVPDLVRPAWRIYQELPESAQAQVQAAAGSGLGALVSGQLMAWATNRGVVGVAQTRMGARSAQLFGIAAAAAVSWLNFQATSARVAGHVDELRSNPVTRPLAEAALPRRTAPPDAAKGSSDE